jgi:hypothetical protein
MPRGGERRKRDGSNVHFGFSTFTTFSSRENVVKLFTTAIYNQA